MKLAYVEVEGFRGFRGRVRVDIPPGFAIIVGPNGVGKSSLCDAVEFAFTGTIRATSAHSERGEHIQDYLWWRGAQSSDAIDHHVEIGLILPDGDRLTVRRTATELKVSPQASLEELIVNPGSILDNPLRHLCQTAILRDEDITTLSVDLGETRRFDFVRDVLGASDYRLFSRRANQVKEHLQRHHHSAQAERDQQQARIVELTARLSEARARAAEGQGLADAEAILTAHLDAPADDATDLLAKAERSVADRRQRLDGLRRIYKQIAEVSSRLQEITTPEHLELVGRLESSLQTVLADADTAAAESTKIQAELKDIQATAPRLASIAQLVEHGGQLGLRDGACPLCGATQTEEDFDKHVGHLRETLAAVDVRLAVLSRDNNVASRRLTEATGRVEQVRAELTRVRTSEEALTAELRRLVSDVEALGETVPADATLSMEQLAHRIPFLESDVSMIERALALLMSSQAAAHVVELEREVATIREQLFAAEKSLLRVVRAQGAVEEGIRTIKRVQGELVDEQLAALSPLLVELYERLRPHVDWRNIRYRLRGDVRRMLSLDVGGGLNPSFMFSSGQRRAAGLAFLIAIFLSRSWCRLHTLIMDDPVQHIDDYRALHLTEVLAAVRRTGYQVVCTIEDGALAELLGRRLRGGAEDWGAVVELGYWPGEGSRVAGIRRLAPFASRVLVAG